MIQETPLASSVESTYTNHVHTFCPAQLDILWCRKMHRALSVVCVADFTKHPQVWVAEKRNKNPHNNELKQCCSPMLLDQVCMVSAPPLLLSTAAVPRGVIPPVAAAGNGRRISGTGGGSMMCMSTFNDHVHVHVP